MLPGCWIQSVRRTCIAAQLRSGFLAAAGTVSLACWWEASWRRSWRWRRTLVDPSATMDRINLSPGPVGRVMAPAIECSGGARRGSTRLLLTVTRASPQQLDDTQTPAQSRREATGRTPSAPPEHSKSPRPSARPTGPGDRWDRPIVAEGSNQSPATAKSAARTLAPPTSTARLTVRSRGQES